MYQGVSGKVETSTTEEHESYDSGERYLGRTDEEEQDGRQERQEDGWIPGPMAT